MNRPKRQHDENGDVYDDDEEDDEINNEINEINGSGGLHLPTFDDNEIDANQKLEKLCKHLKKTQMDPKTKKKCFLKLF